MVGYEFSKSHVVNDYICRHINALSFHVFGNTCGRIKFACSVGYEADEIMEERNVANVVTLDHVFEHDSVISA